MKIRCGDYEIIDSGVIILDKKDSELSFFLREKEPAGVVCHFINDQENANARTVPYINGNNLYIDCINYDNPEGVGLSHPINVGTLDGKKLYLQMWSYLMGTEKSIRKVEYTFYREY